MTDMQVLLEQWAKLEPDRCRDASESPVRHDKEVSMGQDWWQVWDCTEVIEKATVQGATQEAIEARGWHYEQRWYGLERVALVYPTGVGRLGRHESSHIAQSLLAAYLQALKLSGVKHE